MLNVSDKRFRDYGNSDIISRQRDFLRLIAIQLHARTDTFFPRIDGKFLAITRKKCVPNKQALRRELAANIPTLIFLGRLARVAHTYIAGAFSELRGSLRRG